MAIAFATKQEALDFLRGMRGYYEHHNGVFSWDGQYVLVYGEESRPDYTPVVIRMVGGLRASTTIAPTRFAR